MSQMRYAFGLQSLNGIDLDAQKIGEHIEALIDKSHEHVGPDELLADARKTHSPLHKAIEWDENAAAEKWRRKQIKGLVKNLHVAKGGKATKTCAFVYVSHPEHDGKNVYLNVRSAMGRPEFREQVILKAVAQLTRWLNFYGPQLGRRKMLLKDVERLKGRIQRELMAAV